MKIFAPVINLSKINNFSLSFKGKKQPKDYTDSFLAQYEGYSYKQQAEIIKGFDDKINALKDRLNELRSFKGDRRVEINALKKEITRISAQKGEVLKEFNKNVAILYNTNYGRNAVQNYLMVHKEIVPISCLNKSDDEDVGRLWRNSNFFVVNDTPFGAFIDSSYGLNEENFRRLSDKGVSTYSEITDKYGISFDEIQMFLSGGYFKPLTLKNISTEEEIPTRLINMHDKYNSEGIERHNSSLKPSKLSPFINDVSLSADYLSGLGFGDEKALIRAIDAGRIKGKFEYIRTNGGLISKPEIFFNEPTTKSALKKLRTENPNLLNARKILQMTGITKLELENAVRNREIEAIPYCIYPEDENKIFLDLKNPKNADFIYKKSIERSIIRGCSKNDDCISMRLAYELCKKTRAIGNKLLLEFSDLKDIVEKQKKQQLTFSQILRLEKFSNALWEEAGDEEFQEVRKRIKRASKENKNVGLGGIKDEEIREFLMKKASKN